jgi:hypothetical protein
LPDIQDDLPERLNTKRLLEILSGNQSIIPKSWLDYLESICEAELIKVPNMVKANCSYFRILKPNT